MSHIWHLILRLCVSPYLSKILLQLKRIKVNVTQHGVDLNSKKWAKKKALEILVVFNLFDQFWRANTNQNVDNTFFHKQPFRDDLRKRCFETMQQIYRRTPCRRVISIKFSFSKSKSKSKIFATFSKSHFGIDVLLYVCCMF